MKNKKSLYIELLLVFIITLLFNLIGNTLNNDEIWNYGFSYNIANGLIPYKDFNMVVTPFFPMINAIFMIIFGKNIVVFHVLNAIMCMGIFYYLKKYSNKGCYIAYAILLKYAMPNYSLMGLCLLLILIDMEKNKRNDYLIGIVLGLTFLTKQNIGLFLCVPTLFTRDLKKIGKRIVGFIIPNLLLLIYLIYNDCLFEFIDYCFLGMSDFAGNNTMVYTSTLIIMITSIIYLIYKYIKTKEIMVLYLLCFMGLSYPIVDPYHVMIPFIPVFNYFLSNLKLDKRIVLIFTCSFILAICLVTYMDYTKGYSYPNETYQFKYRKISDITGRGINKLSDYVKENEAKLYIIHSNAYFIKLNAGVKINKYDLLFNGNMGKDGDIRVIDELDNRCKNTSCIFLIDKEALNNNIQTQYNEKIHNYVINNYHDRGMLMGLSIYTNE